MCTSLPKGLELRGKNQVSLGDEAARVSPRKKDRRTDGKLDGRRERSFLFNARVSVEKLLMPEQRRHSGLHVVPSPIQACLPVSV